MTPEEIAREAAEGFARVKVHPDGMASVYVGTVCVRGRMDGAATAGAFADAVRHAVRALALAAVERALREVPVPGALGEREVAGVLGVMAYLDDAAGADAPVLVPRQVREIRDAFRSVCADNDHLRRALHDCGQDGTADVWAGGYEAGRASVSSRVELVLDYRLHREISLAQIPGPGDTLIFKSEKATTRAHDDLWAIVESRTFDADSGKWTLYLDVDDKTNLLDEALIARVFLGSPPEVS